MSRIYSVLFVSFLLLLSTQTVFAGRYYDSATGRWLTVDPKADKYPGWSPYNYALNNPLKYIDPNGKEVYVASNGYVNWNIPVKDANDPRVYLVMNDKQTLIGELGGKIDANTIYSNLLNQNISYAEGISNPFTFYSLVKTGGEWDLKNNENTIFGVANKSKFGETLFEFGETKMEPQDIGNHHFGATGMATGLFSEWLLQSTAGFYQILSGTSKPEWQSGKMTPYIFPYGDDPKDQIWMMFGFDYYEKNKEDR